MPALKNTIFFTLIFIFLVIVGPAPTIGYTEHEITENSADMRLGNIIDKQMEGLDLDIIDKFWMELEREAGEYLPNLHWTNFLSWARTGEDGTGVFVNFLQGLLRYLFREVVFNLNLLGQLIMLAVAASLLKNLQIAFGGMQVSQITQAVVFITLLGLALSSFIAAVEIGQGAIDGMVDFMFAIIPILLTLLASLGSFSTAAIFHPVIIFVVNFFAATVKNVIFPLIFFAVILAIVNHFSDSFNVDKLAEFFKNVCIWGLGLILTIFVGVTAIQGVAGTVTDAVTLRTAKFMTGAFIPVVGKMIADAVETVAGASLLVKNSVTIIGLITLFLITVFPLIKIMSIVVIYKVAGALVQPLGDTALSECLNTMGNYLILIFAAVITVSLVFFISMTIIFGAGNAAMMLR